jgi:branched-chain amino acid aminotransferase
VAAAGLRREVEATMAAHGATGEAYIRILLTRGVGELTYRPSACPTPTLIVIVKTFVPQDDAVYDRGVNVALVGVRRNHVDSVSPMIKSNNLLNNALAMQEAFTRGADEALMQNVDGRLVECAQSNFFLIRAGQILTPPLADGLLPGITRAFVMAIARDEGVDCREASLTPADLLDADEAFLTGTTREITPIVSVDGTAIGAGQPGPITRALLDAFRARVRAMTPRP